MSNRAYANIWCLDFTEDTLLERFSEFLTTIPFSSTRPGFSGLTVRAVGPAETPILDPDLRSTPADPVEALELMREHLHADSAYELSAFWDLFSFELATKDWHLRPEPLLISCYGPEYDEGIWRDDGNFQIDLGLEYLFTGHAGLLGFEDEALAKPQDQEEAVLLEFMTQPANLRAYHQKTAENIRKLFDWMDAVEKTMPIDKIRLWSEGEEDLQARLEDILAVL
jgi:hypothetical protein